MGGGAEGCGEEKSGCGEEKSGCGEEKLYFGATVHLYHLLGGWGYRITM